jgi:hypothetical protein
VSRSWTERDSDYEHVRREHLEQVNERGHWAYLIGVLVAGTIVMLLLIAWLGSSAA